MTKQVRMIRCDKCHGAGKIMVYHGPTTARGREAMALIEPNVPINTASITCSTCGGTGWLRT